MKNNANSLFAIFIFFAPFAVAGDFLDGALFTQLGKSSMGRKAVYANPLPSLQFGEGNKVELNFETTLDGIKNDGKPRDCTYAIEQKSRSSVEIDITCNNSKTTYLLTQFRDDWILSNNIHNEMFELKKSKKPIVLPQ